MPIALAPKQFNQLKKIGTGDVFLPVICLSVLSSVTHPAAPCLHHLMHLHAIWQIQLRAPMIQCVNWGIPDCPGEREICTCLFMIHQETPLVSNFMSHHITVVTCYLFIALFVVECRNCSHWACTRAFSTTDCH